MPRHLQGGKFTASHTTIIEPAERVIHAASRLNTVTKISLGLIQRVPSKKARLMFTEIPAGLKLTVIGTGSLQDFVIYTSDRPAVIAALEAAFVR